MVKIALVTDNHLRTKTPTHRTDADFASVVLGKLEYVHAQADAEGCVAVCSSGDLSDHFTWDNSISLITRFVQLRNRYAHIPFIMTLGQHDVKGHDIAGYENYIIGLLGASKHVQILIGGQSLMLEDTKPKVIVSGYGFGEFATEQFLSGKLDMSKEEAFKLALVHASVGGTRKQIGDVCIFEGIAEQNVRAAHYTSFGDIHEGFAEYTFGNGNKAIGLGGMWRKNKDEADRVPKFAILTVNDDLTASLDVREIYHLPSSVAFNLSDAQTVHVDRALEFKNILKDTAEISSETDRERVTRMIGELHLSQAHATLAKEYLDTVEVD